MLAHQPLVRSLQRFRILRSVRMREEGISQTKKPINSL